MSRRARTGDPGRMRRPTSGARAQALEDAEKIAQEVERIASEFDGPDTAPSDRVLRLEIMPGQRWTGFLGAVEVAITRATETGGGPEDKHDLYVERSPITYVDRVQAPVLLMVGDNDTRCPLQQVLNYAERLTELGKPFELDRFDAGHGALVVNERIRQMEVLLRFAAAHVPGGAEPEA